MTRSTSLRIKGFSLVELMVALGLTAIVAGFGIRSSIRSNEQKKVTEAAQTIRQYFMQAKSMALAGKKDCTACGGVGGVCGNGDSKLEGWRVVVTNTTPPTLEVYGECIVAGLTVPFFSSGVKSLPNRVTVSSTPVNALFLPLSQGTSLPGLITITVGSTMANITTKTFTVSPQGEISAIP